MYIYKAKKSSGKSVKYYVELHDHLGTRRRFAGFTDYHATRTYAHNLERLISFKVAGCIFDAEITSFIESLPKRTITRLISIGLLDPKTNEKASPLMIAHKTKPLRSSYVVFEVTGGLLADYKEHLESKELSKNHVKVSIGNCANLISGEKWSFLSDITPQAVNSYINHARSSGVSVRKINSNILSLKGFCTWLCKQGVIDVSPLKDIAKLKVKSGKVVTRRALSRVEIDKLLNGVYSNDNTHYGLSSFERGLVYEVALTTGLRYNEIRTLVRADFDFSRQIITLQGKNAKNGHTAALPLKPTLCDKIEAHFTSNQALPQARAFGGMRGGAGAKMIKVDLEAVGLEYSNDMGKADFHSLRHTFCTMLAKSGVQPQVAQRLMRHSSVDLTMNFYTHILIEDKAEAISQLPSFEVAEAVLTGTNESTENTDNIKGCFLGGNTGENWSNLTNIGCYESAEDCSDLGSKKADNSVFDNELTALDIGTRSRIRTVDLLIKSQLL